MYQIIFNFFFKLLIADCFLRQHPLVLDKHEATINSQNTGTLCTLLIHLTKQLSPVPCSYSQEYLDPDSVDTMFSYHASPKESLGILLDSKLEK